MTLGDAARRDLIAHLAQRFPGWGARADVARAAGLGDVQLTGDAPVVWQALVSEAESRGEIAALLRAAARARPEDAVLGAMADSAAAGDLVIPAADDPAAWIRGAAIAGTIVAVIGLLALVGDLSGLSSPAAPPTIEPEPASESAVPTEFATAPATESEPPSEAARVPPAEPAVEPEPEVEPAAEPQPEVEPAPTAFCTGPAGKVVGYAYAGSTSPGSVGGTWIAPRSLNVRVDYPRRENGWSSRARVACVLPGGAQVRLEQAPIAVDGGVFWVPVVAGSTRAP